MRQFDRTFKIKDWTNMTLIDLRGNFPIVKISDHTENEITLSVMYGDFADKKVENFFNSLEVYLREKGYIQ